MGTVGRGRTLVRRERPRLYNANDSYGIYLKYMREMVFPVLVDCKAVNQSKSPRVSHTRGLGRRQEGLGAECCCRPRRQRGSASSGSELPPPILLGLTLYRVRLRVFALTLC